MASRLIAWPSRVALPVADPSRATRRWARSCWPRVSCGSPCSCRSCARPCRRRASPGRPTGNSRVCCWSRSRPSRSSPAPSRCCSRRAAGCTGQPAGWSPPPSRRTQRLGPAGGDPALATDARRGRLAYPRRLMERENVETVRRAYEVFASGDREAAMELLHPDVVWCPAAALLMEQSIYHGPEAVCRLLFEEIPSIIDNFRVELLEVHEVAEDKVLAIGRFRGRIHGTETEFNQTFGQLFTERDGRAIRMDSYSSRREALDALGVAQ